MILGTVRELWRYPVSSVAGERLDTATLAETGVERDRLWGLFDAEGAVAAPEGERRWRPVPSLRARLAGDTIEVGRGETWHELPSTAADAEASGHLGFAVRFAPFLPGIAAEQPGAPRYARSPLHILTTASLDKLRELVRDAIIDTPRFRPNIVIETCKEHAGFVEQDLIGRTISIGAARMEITEPCARCAFTALGLPGLPFDKDVLHAIARHGGGGFGILAKVLEPATISLEDEVLIA